MEIRPTSQTIQALLAVGLRHSLAGLLFYCIQFGFPAFALQTSEPTSLDQIVVVGSRLQVTLREEAESITVITREQIEDMNVATGSDLLRQVAGVQVDQIGGAGGLSSVYIRGSDPNHVLVLLDGVRVNDPTNSRGGSFDLSSLDPSQIERIEVLRGSASSIYGADAMGGVINVITRRGDIGWSATAGLGGLGYEALSVRSPIIGSDTHSLSGAASTLRDGQEQKGGGLELSQIGIAGTLGLSDNVRLELDLRRGRRRGSGFPDDSGGIRLAEIRTLEHKHADDTIFRVRGVRELEKWSIRSEATSFQHMEDIDSPGVAPGIRSDLGLPASKSQTNYRRRSGVFDAVMHMTDSSELAIGGEFQQEHGTSNTVYELFGSLIPATFDLRRDTRSVFTELKWITPSSLIVRVGLRHDSIEGDSQVSPNIGLRYNLPEGASLRASYSEGFKPASFFSLGLPAALGGNSALKAEHSKAESVSYERPLWGGIGDVSIALFRTNYTDLVTFDNDINQLVNASSVNVEGAEIAISIQANKLLSLQANYTHLSSYVDGSNDPLRQRPSRRGGIQALLSINERSRIVWRLEYADETFDSSIPTGNLFLPTYVRNDVAYTHKIGSRISVSAAIDNLFDRRNEWYVGQRSQERRARVGVRIAF